MSLAGFIQSASAQTQNGNLQNPDFESWTPSGNSWIPDGWNNLWPVSMATKSGVGDPVHCGNHSCRVNVDRASSEVGKLWWSSPPITGSLVVRFRVLYPTAANQPSNTITGVLTARAEGYAPSSWTPVAGSTFVPISASDDWQEFELAFHPSSTTNADRVRFYFDFANGSGQVYFIDSVDFTGTDQAAYGALQPTIARQVRSSGLSLVYDQLRGVVSELRAVQGMRAVGPNYLAPGHTTGLFWSFSSQGDASHYESTNPGYTTVTPMNSAGRTGWDINYANPLTGLAVSTSIYSQSPDPAIFSKPRSNAPTRIAWRRSPYHT